MTVAAEPGDATMGCGGAIVDTAPKPSSATHAVVTSAVAVGVASALL